MVKITITLENNEIKTDVVIYYHDFGKNKSSSSELVVGTVRLIFFINN